MFPCVRASGELRAGEATQSRGGFLILLFRKAEQGSGSPHTPKALTLMDSFARARESALDTRGGPSRDLAASRVFHRGPQSAGPDADVEGPRIPPTRLGFPCAASLAISEGFAFAFLRLSCPVSVFGLTRESLIGTLVSRPHVSVQVPPVLLWGETSLTVQSNGMPWAPLGTEDSALGSSCLPRRGSHLVNCGLHLP